MEKDNMEDTVSWILNSGIQNPERLKDVNNTSLFGSFNAWFDLEKGEYSYAYVEISGYAITTLLYIFNIKKEDIFLQRAIEVGNWLLSVQDECGAFPTAFYPQKISFKKPQEFHTFDVGMVFNGLALLYRETKEEKYLTAAKKAADWVISHQQSDGSIVAQVNTKTQSSSDSGKTWSTQSGSYHAKLAIGFLNIFDLTEDKVYRDAAVKLCDYALTKQNSEGQFLTYGDIPGTNLHPHMYSVEGLYVAGQYLNNEKYLNAAEQAMRWTLAHEKGGCVPRHKHGNIFNYNERVDILAQVLRMAYFFNIKDRCLESLKEVVLSYRYDGGVVEQRGGFMFGKLSNGVSAPHINSWVTMFALQALMARNQKTLSNPFLLI